MEDRLPNIDLGKTQITDKIRVSSAAIYNDGNWFGAYYQIETWIFSEDERIKSKMQIHDTCGREIPDSLINHAKTFHRRISKMLIKKLNEPCN